MTMSPEYYNGTIYVGMSGGEFGGRGSETAYDAATGQFKSGATGPCPSPGDVGFSTWPDNTEWMHGGATIWNNPSIDPRHEPPHLHDRQRRSVERSRSRQGPVHISFVSLDPATGQYQWHYQVVHHDIWDYDCPSPTVQFDVQIGPVMQHGVAESCKTGWIYELNRDTGAPLDPGNIVEKKSAAGCVPAHVGDAALRPEQGARSSSAPASRTSRATRRPARRTGSAASSRRTTRRPMRPSRRRRSAATTGRRSASTRRRSCCTPVSRRPTWRSVRSRRR